MSVSTPLLDTDADAPPDAWGAPSKAAPVRSRSVALKCKDRVPLIACAISVLALLLNLVLHPPFLARPSLAADKVPLRYPDPYPGLVHAVLPASFPLPAPITNFPLLMAHVNASAPAQVYLEHRNWIGSFGTIYGGETTFVVGNGASTLTQFRTVDWGMETCVLTLALNSSVSTSPPLLDVWTLDSDAPLNVSTLSWDTRPGRKALLGPLKLANTADGRRRDYSVADSLVGAPTPPPAEEGRPRLESPSFPCPVRALFTFEVVCAGGPCAVELLQTNRDTELGFYLVQHASRALGTHPE
ncbi:hypothetical protein B0H15DRAFT_817501 [Mycena belliarum]|uniref:Ubiquitin 3 binding protein But2 C-terminal domain-containing protein n=1 Tax=Mycena belliarum TaxID=1033014 RepID=A0AAD6XY16_9AGAR|nr:hypothetical protein B0H15DRAFT_817501 [Mycena belliae]